MRVIITGATGFIGQKIIEDLLESDIEIVAVIRPDTKKKLRVFPSEKVKVIKCDFTEIIKLQELLKIEGIETADHFIHLAWNGTTGEERQNSKIQLENVKNSLECFKIAEALNCKTFFFSGSQAEYGNIVKNGYFEQKEENNCYPENEYGKNKLAFGEKILNIKCKIKVYHGRIFSVYGPHDQENSLIETMIKKLSTGETMELGPCEHDWNFTYINDISKMITSLIFSNAPSGIYNLANEETKSLKFFVEEIIQSNNWEGNCIINGRSANPNSDLPLRPNTNKIREYVNVNLTDFSTGIRETIAFDIARKDMHQTITKNKKL